MRPLRLDLAGFTVFREPTTVDFTDADFFALTGPTGSGKSTILDGICFALYGTAPRWNDRRAISNALAPSVAECRVRLIFESGGSRYAATRVVRRDGKGRVSTTHAGLELLPSGFDLSRLDTGLDSDDLGDPLAGTPAEMEAAVVEAVGLPFDQFTSCVILPQGQFAEFLHAKPAVRQQILVNLLGLRVYEKIREQAGTLALQAEEQLKATDRQVVELADADDEALAAAASRLDGMTRLAADVDLAVPTLAGARRTAESAQAALTTLDGELARLSSVAAPSGTAGITAAAVAARAAARQTAALVLAAEDREEKLRGDLASAGDANELRRMLDLHSELGQITAQVTAADETLAAADAEHGASVAALEQATTVVASATALVTAAEAEVETARTADRAATLRPGLRLGEPCPVCVRTVTTLPPMPETPLLAAASAALNAARDRVTAAAEQATAHDRAVRERDRTLAGARARRDQLAARLAALDARLAGAPGIETLRGELKAINRLTLELDDASTGVREARDTGRHAAAEAQKAGDRIQAAWRAFDTVRDGVATFGPPPADRDDLATSWETLTCWAAEQSAGRVHERAGAVESVRAAQRACDDAERAIVALFLGTGLDAPGKDHARFAAIAVEQARAAAERLAERRARADRLRTEREAHETEARVARALAQHLRANNFERWLLAEALDNLVEGASRILRELSGGQYDLGHDKGEFFVVDHYDAALRRPVRTLSGGETFQASLALALALSEQLAGMSTGAASLESIVLDEGFGTLDVATLDTVAATLENLAARGDRMVGVVTHVPALAERIPVRFDVRKNARTSSVERIG